MKTLLRAWERFLEHRCPRMAAALSYYTVFSLPAILLLAMMAAGWLLPGGEADRRIGEEIGRLVGPEAGRQMLRVLEGLDAPGGGGVATTLLGLVVLVFGATRAFAELQEALNVIWGIPAPAQPRFRKFVAKRLLSFSMILVLALLLLVSLVVSTVIRWAGETVSAALPIALPDPVLQSVPSAISLLILPVYFVALFAFVPDTDVNWRRLWPGAFLTAVLFEAGKVGIGLYMSRADPGSAYGAAGSLVIMLVWIYYSANAFFLGAEITRLWSAPEET